MPLLSPSTTQLLLDSLSAVDTEDADFLGAHMSFVGSAQHGITDPTAEADYPMLAAALEDAQTTIDLLTRSLDNYARDFTQVPVGSQALAAGEDIESAEERTYAARHEATTRFRRKLAQHDPDIRSAG